MNLENVDMAQVQILADKFLEYWVSVVPNIIWAILVLWIGLKIVNMINRMVDKIMLKHDWDPMLESFITNLIAIVLKVVVIISAAGMIGVQTSSFIAMLAAAGLAIGMALSGTLQNFAWWVMILMFKPYKIGDYIEAGWHAWSVKEIHIFNTILLSWDKKTIIIPNSDISNASMVNYSTQPKRRIDLQVWVSYSDDIDLVKETLKEISESEERVLLDEWVTIGLAELWDNAVIFNFRVFVKASDYWPVRYDILENIKKTFDKKGISFPFPQRDVHLFQEK